MKKKPVSPRFKIVGHYLYPPVESAESFETIEAARAENRVWTKEAEAQGLRWRGRVVPADDA